tara:strand:+ start:1126 stop:1443 length:318 start_codon:yes stop_codon:yes gene_type:complete
MDLKYKNYSLAHLRDAIKDAITSEATPEEIYVTVVSSIRQEVAYHNACIRTSKRLLDLTEEEVVDGENRFRTDEEILKEIEESGGYEWTPQVVSTKKHGKDMDAL